MTPEIERLTPMSHPEETPLVSLVIPVYNAMPYLVELLDMLPKQGLDPSQLEVILVNDGSDDGSEKVLAEYASRHPNYRLIDQPNSGGPADPCNKGIAAVTGKYFFVVGADDVLTENTLGDLARYAEDEGSDIVLAKMAGLNGRHAPSSMFQRSVADGDIVADKLYNSLTAIKLFRTDLVTKTGAHNPTHLRVGSDQPFTLACYLVAKKISVRADRDYVLVRKRDDGKNVTSSYRSAWDYAQLVTASFEVIEKWSEPGPLRDGILRRPVRGALTKALWPRFLDLDEDQQQRVVDELRRVVPPLLTPAAAAHLSSLPRLKLRLALDGKIDALRRVIAWQRDSTKELLVPDGTGFRFDLPADLAAEIDDELLHDVQVNGIVALEDLEIDGMTLNLVASARVSRSTAPPDEVALRLRDRAEDDWEDLPAIDVQEVGRSGTPALQFRATLDAARYPKGVQDLYVVHRYGSVELVNRLGRHRSERIEERPRRLLDPVRGRDLGIAYFTKGYGNLSLDIGYTVNDKPGPDARLLTVLRSGAEERIAILSGDELGDLRAVVHAEKDAPGDGEQVRVVPAGERLAAVSLPGGHGTQLRWLSVSEKAGTSTLELPPAVDVSTGKRTPPSMADALAGAGKAGRSVARRLGVRRRR
jgi:hypothetical protein